MSNTRNRSSYYAGFDYLRAILSLAVIAIHTKVMSAHGRFSVDELSGINVFDIIHFNLFFLAVPVFFTISLFLLYKKDEALSKSGRRIYHFFILYVFWTSAWILFKDTRPGDGLADIVIYILRGGKSIFWFFFSLVFVTALAAFTKKLSTQLTWIALCASIVMVALFPILNMQNPGYRYLVAFWNPLLFIPYVFGAKLFVHYEETLKSAKHIPTLLLIAFVALCSVEWATLVHPNHELVQVVQLPLYARVSVVIGAFALFIAFLQVKGQPPRVIKVLSSASLGMYCVHPFLIELTKAIRNESTGLNAVIYFLAIATASLIMTYFLKQIFQARLT